MMTDVEFFERNPERKFRVRMCTQDEIDYMIAAGIREPDSDEYAYIAIHDTGRKFRRIFFSDIYAPTKRDLDSEDQARAVFENCLRSETVVFRVDPAR